MARIAWGRNKTQLDLNTYPDNPNVPIGSSEWNEDPEDGGLLGFTKQTATVANNTFAPTTSVIEIGSGTVNTITQTDTNEFDLLYLFASSGATVTLAHNNGGTGQITLLAGVNKTLSETTPTILIRKGTAWVEYGGGITNALNDVGDVTITNASQYETLTYNGSNWVNNSPDKLYYVCKNAGGTSIAKGKFVYISGYDTVNSYIEISLASNTSASTMPSFGITMEAISAGSTGKVLQQGKMTGLNTDGIAEGTTLYIGTSGDWVTTKPTGTALIQNVGEVLKDNLTDGHIHVGGSGRANDVPNIADGKIWIGNSSAVATEVTPSGDATITNAGVISVSDLTISGETSQDLLYFNGSNWVRLAKGTDGQVLKTESGSLAWGAGGGEATIVHTYSNTTNTSYTGTASSFGTVGVGDRDIYIKKIDANNEGVFTKIWKNGSAVEVQIA